MCHITFGIQLDICLFRQSWMFNSRSNNSINHLFHSSLYPLPIHVDNLILVFHLLLFCFSYACRVYYLLFPYQLFDERCLILICFSQRNLLCLFLNSQTTSFVSSSLHLPSNYRIFSYVTLKTFVYFPICLKCQLLNFSLTSSKCSPIFIGSRSMNSSYNIALVLFSMPHFPNH